MAYITTEEVKAVRETLKAMFPKTFKFSVTREHCSVINVRLMESPLKFEKEYEQINHFHLAKKKHRTILSIISEIANKENFNNSDPMSDYHHVGFYCHMTIGKWDKPYKQILI